MIYLLDTNHSLHPSPARQACGAAAHAVLAAPPRSGADRYLRHSARRTYVYGRTIERDFERIGQVTQLTVEVWTDTGA